MSISAPPPTCRSPTAYTSNVLESNLLEVTAHAELLAVIADPLRLTVIHRLAREGTRCVCDLQPEPPIPDNQLSYHLRVLRDAGLVTAARRGRWMDYTLNYSLLSFHVYIETILHFRFLTLIFRYIC